MIVSRISLLVVLHEKYLSLNVILICIDWAKHIAWTKLPKI